MNRIVIAAVLFFFVAPVSLLQGCGRNTAKASVDAGLAVEQMPRIDADRRAFLRWHRESGPTAWERSRERDVRAIRGVGRAPD
ncbi:MAG: hypothetical protein PVI30_16970 [Myxococcales bacterium]|jgi:hypothetical protein